MESTLTFTVSMPLSCMAVLIFSVMDAGVSLWRATATEAASTVDLAAGMVMVYATTAVVPSSRRRTSAARRRLHSIQTVMSLALISLPAAWAMPLASESFTLGRAAKASQSGTVRSMVPATRLAASVVVVGAAGSVPVLVVAVVVGFAAVGSVVVSVAVAVAGPVAVVAGGSGAARPRITGSYTALVANFGKRTVTLASGPLAATTGKPLGICTHCPSIWTWLESRHVIPPPRSSVPSMPFTCRTSASPRTLKSTSMCSPVWASAPLPQPHQAHPENPTFHLKSPAETFHRSPGGPTTASPPNTKASTPNSPK
mmetsp:Transcript_91999/g.256302  ORF Transcript_91999/g.256302 Transcript_91999/m.256302 type:complete len:313 (+) Transcript_91999:311-1249(+)